MEFNQEKISSNLSFYSGASSSDVIRVLQDVGTGKSGYFFVPEVDDLDYGFLFPEYSVVQIEENGVMRSYKRYYSSLVDADQIRRFVEEIIFDYVIYRDAVIFFADEPTGVIHDGVIMDSYKHLASLLDNADHPVDKDFSLPDARLTGFCVCYDEDRFYIARG